MRKVELDIDHLSILFKLNKNEHEAISHFLWPPGLVYMKKKPKNKKLLSIKIYPRTNCSKQTKL